MHHNYAHNTPAPGAPAAAATAPTFPVDDGDDDLAGRCLLRDSLDALQRDAVTNTLAIQHTRPTLEDRTKPFVQRYADSDREPLTWFHSQQTPASPLLAVFDSVAKRIPTFDATTGRAAVVLMRRYSAHTGLAITTAMVHRLFLAALVVAAKAHHDHLVRHRDLAKIAGLHPLEVERMELAVCVGIDWRAQVSAEHLRAALTAADGLLSTPVGGGSSPLGRRGDDKDHDDDDGDAAFAATDDVPSALSSWTSHHHHHDGNAGQHQPSGAR